MKTKALTLILATSLGIPPLHAEDLEQSSARKPTLMSVMIGGINGPSYEITYDQRELRYYSADNFLALKKAKPVVINPTNEQWQAFFAAMEKRQTWKWKRRYDSPDVHDGTYWRAFISYETRDTRDVLSSGSNAYPEDFKEFLAAIRQLVGERKFE